MTRQKIACTVALAFLSLLVAHTEEFIYTVFFPPGSDSGTRAPKVTGTDSPGIPGLVPGFSLHKDLHALEQAGLTRYQVPLGVMVQGHWRDASELQGLLESVAAKYRAAAEP